MRKKLLTAILFLFIQLTAFSQIRGEILDAQTGSPVPGATILFSDKDEGTVSEPDGSFTGLMTEELIISAIGYRTTVVKTIPGKDFYTIRLEPVDYELEEVIVEAFNRSRRLIDVPGSLTMISNEQLEQEKPVTIISLINQAPGVFAHSGSLNTSRITIRGIGARVPYGTGKVRAYLNNIPLTTGSGTSIVEDIDPAVMERIEIIKGPATSAYGAGLGGTIIITARKPMLHPAAVTNNFQTGSWDLYRNTISLDAGDDNYGISLQYNHTQSNGFRENNEYRRDGLTLISQASPDDKTDVTVLVAYTSLKAFIPSSIDSLTYTSRPEAAAQNWLQTRGYEDYDKLLGGISAQYRFNSSFSGNLSLFSTLNSEEELRPFDVLNEERFSGGTRLNLAYSRPAGTGSWQLLWGGELFSENFRYTSYENIEGVGERGEMISNNEELISYYNLFAQTDLDLHRLHLSAGINLNSSRTNYQDLFNTDESNPSGVYSYGSIISPRISASYRYYQNNSVFFTISHGFSPPSLAETLTPEGFINPDIRPEKSWNIEGGFRGNAFNNILFYDLNVYRMQVENLLVAERVGEDAWVGRNAGESVHRGVEAELHFILFESEAGNSDSWWQPDEISMRPNVTINHFRFSDFIDNGIDQSGNRLPGVPDFTGNTGLYGKLQGGLYALVNHRLIGRMPMNDANSLFTEPYQVTEFTLGYENDVSARFFVDAFVSARNIFDISYPSMILVNAPSFGNRPPRYYYPGNPVNFTTGIKVSYRLN